MIGESTMAVLVPPEPSNANLRCEYCPSTSRLLDSTPW